jgi:CBS domain-containing protein
MTLVKDIMSTALVAGSPELSLPDLAAPDQTVEAAARRMPQADIHLLVVEGDRLEGIVTTSDVTRAGCGTEGAGTSTEAAHDPPIGVIKG